MTLRKTGRLNDRKPDPGTDRSESVRDFQNFVGPGPVRDLEIFLSRLRPKLGG